MIDPGAPDFSSTPVAPGRARFTYEPADTGTVPVATIVTPFYDTGPVFHETARSVFQQSFQQWEWLIVNDGSTNAEALAVLDAYRDRDRRVRVVDLPRNVGLSAARNEGFRAARTAYVLQLDSDDLLEPTALEKWLWFLESNREYAMVKGYTVGFGAEEYLWQRGFHSGPEFLDANLVAPTALIRTAAHAAVGGYDGGNRAGLEDWDFWLRIADAGHWGATVPEFLDWYRRRARHVDRWTNWDHGERQSAFHAGLRARYPKLWNGGFPTIRPRWHMPNEPVPDELPATNALEKNGPRLLMVIPWMSLGGADKFNLNLIEQLTAAGWEVTIAATSTGGNEWEPAYTHYTPDVFVLHRFLRLPDYPRFLRYLIGSRRPDVVMVTQSELGYLLLPYLRAHAPDTAFCDFTHIEEEEWKHGGYPNRAVQYQEQLELTIAASRHLAQWQIDRGADPDRVRVCYIDTDTRRWKPDAAERTATRAELGIGDDVPVLLYAARICPQKQPDVFAATMRRLRERGCPFVALVAGAGPDLPSLQQRIAADGLSECVRFLGPVEPDRVRRLMLAADLFFLPSRWEGIALTFYEAMACGLPIVGADVGGQHELVTSDCGVLLSRSDPATEAGRYADVLAELIADPARRQAMAAAARRRIEREFTLEHLTERMLELFDELRRLHEKSPRAVVPSALARAIATEAVEYVRVFGLADQLWAETQKPLHWRVALATVLGRLQPIYDRLVRWHCPFLPAVRARARRRVLGGAA